MINPRISLDLDDTLTDFENSYNNYFNTDISKEHPYITTKNVHTLRKNKQFWENLPVLERINFIPENYCTKRINSKVYTKNWLMKNGFPIRPIYQMLYQYGNKSKLIKGKTDVLIDDSISNFIVCNLSGLPTLLIDRPHNQKWGPIGRVYHLDKEEIEETYNLFKCTMLPYFRELVENFRKIFKSN